MLCYVIVSVALLVVYRRHPSLTVLFFCTLIVHNRMIMLSSRSEFIILSREDRKRSTIFPLVINLSFYRFGIRSCLATSYKQILETPCSMTSSCILGFQATRPPTIGWQIKGKGSLHRLDYSVRQLLNNRRV